MLELQFELYLVEIVDDPTFALGSADNTISYDLVYGDDDYRSASHGVLVYEAEQLRRSALIWAGGGATGVHETSATICDAALFVCCGNKLFSVSLPELRLLWATKADDVCCFQVFEYDQDLIVHGELAVSRIGADGNKKWSTGFADITVTPDGRSSFHMNPDYIEVVDWLDNRYKVDYQTGESVMVR